MCVIVQQRMCDTNLVEALPTEEPECEEYESQERCVENERAEEGACEGAYREEEKEREEEDE